MLCNSPATILPAGDLGASSLDCSVTELRANQKLLVTENLFCIRLSVAKGWSSITHSLGENLLNEKADLVRFSIFGRLAGNIKGNAEAE